MTNPSTTDLSEVTTWPIRGQDDAVETLRSAVERGRPRHAYIFGGPEGTGKSALATAFAQALQCDQPSAPGIACRQCRSCRKIARGVHPDVQTFSLERQAALAERGSGKNTSLTIESVRELTAMSALRPMEGRWRVILIEDAETLQDVAQEALLKMLEEPPGFMVLVLLTDDAETLLPTVRSRCESIDVRHVPHPIIVQSLTDSGAREDLARDVAALATGRIGWAHRAITEPALVKRRREALDRALTWAQADGYHRLVTAVRMGDAFTKKRDETFLELEAALSLWRDVLLARLGLPRFMMNPTQAEQYGELFAGWDVGALHRAIGSVQECIGDLETNVRPRLALEAMVLQWPTR